MSPNKNYLESLGSEGMGQSRTEAMVENVIEPAEEMVRFLKNDRNEFIGTDMTSVEYGDVRSQYQTLLSNIAVDLGLTAQEFADQVKHLIFWLYTRDDTLRRNSSEIAVKKSLNAARMVQPTQRIDIIIMEFVLSLKDEPTADNQTLAHLLAHNINLWKERNNSQGAELY